MCASVRWAWRDEVSAFEREFAGYIGRDHALGTSFGRTALYAGLKAAGVRGREVIVPAFTCTVVRHAIVMAGAAPRFVDIDPGTFEMDLEDLRRKISPKAKAILFIHYFGRVSRKIEEVMAIARKNGMLLIEDCAHSLGSEFRGKKIGSFGDFAIFSLTKNTLNCGGGVLVTDDRKLYKRARAVLLLEKVSRAKRWADFPMVLAYGLEQGIDKVILDRVGAGTMKWWLTKVPRLVMLLRRFVLFALIGLAGFGSGQSRERRNGAYGKHKGNGKYAEGIHMEPLIASLGRSQLRKIDELNEKRRRAYEALRGLSGPYFDASGRFQGIDVHTYLVLRFPQDDIFKVIEKCREKGISLKPTWPTHQSLWAGQDTPAVSRIAKEVVTYCIHPGITPEEIQRLGKAVGDCGVGA